MSPDAERIAPGLAEAPDLAELVRFIVSLGNRLAVAESRIAEQDWRIAELMSARRADPDEVLLAEIVGAFPGWFTANEVWAKAIRGRDQAEAEGQTSDLFDAFESAGIGTENAHALGRWLRRQEKSGLVQRSDSERAGVRWCLAVSSSFKPAKPPSAFPE